MGRVDEKRSASGDGGGIERVRAGRARGRLVEGSRAVTMAHKYYFTLDGNKTNADAAR